MIMKFWADRSPAFRCAVLFSYAAALCAVSLVPGNGGVPTIPHVDKVGHFLAYAGLGAIVAALFGSKKTRVLGWLAAFALGLLLEYLQSFVPFRDTSLADAVANTLGVAAGGWGLLRWRKP